MLGGLTAFGFYVIDTIGVDQSWFGGIQSARLALSMTFLAVSIFCVAKLGFVTRHYASLFTLVATVFVGFGCFIAYEGHKNEWPEGLLWAVDMTLVICIVVLFGFSRLSALASTAIASVGAIATIMFLLTSSDIDKAQTAGMSIHLLIIAICCFSLRHGIERREWVSLYFCQGEPSPQSLCQGVGAGQAGGRRR